jgi:hypothetical protein
MEMQRRTIRREMMIMNIRRNQNKEISLAGQIRIWESDESEKRRIEHERTFSSRSIGAGGDQVNRNQGTLE